MTLLIGLTEINLTIGGKGIDKLKKSFIIRYVKNKMMNNFENFTITIPMTENTKERDIFKVGKHSIKLDHNDSIIEWEITSESRNALLQLHSIKLKN